jgi:hypothetical protein
VPSNEVTVGSFASRGWQVISDGCALIGSRCIPPTTLALVYYFLPLDASLAAGHTVRMRKSFFRQSFALFALVPMLAFAGCASDAVDPQGDDVEEDLTSLTARKRSLSFEGVVYVNEGSSDESILRAIRNQTQTGLGAFLEQEVTVNNRELSTIDASTLKKRVVSVIDPAAPTSAGTKKLEVRYTYKDQAVVSTSFARQSSMASALLRPDYQSESSRIRRECTPNDSHSVGYPIWYEFKPARETCLDAIKAESTQIAADRRKVGAEQDSTRVPTTEANRLYLPITVALGRDTTSGKTSYPEYQKLFAGGVAQNKLVVGLVFGPIDDNITAENATSDTGYREFMDTLKILNEVMPTAKITSEGSDSITSSGERLSGITPRDFVNWHQGRGFPAAINTAGKQETLRKDLGRKLYRNWFTFSQPVKVQIGSAAAKDFTIEIQAYYGAEEDTTPHRRALKTSDIYFYNGHSYVGGGPLSPTNYRQGDFADSYQIFFIDGCVSYNYYHKGYLPLKPGGTKSLDLITNGLEAPAYRSGYAMGQMLKAILSGKASYQEILRVGSATDSHRVVDGELDNTFNPTRQAITIKTQ